MRTPVALRTRGDLTTNHRVGYCVVKAQRGARLMVIAPVRDCTVDVRSPKRALRGSARSSVPLLKGVVVDSSASLSTNPTSSHLNPTRTHQYHSNSSSKRNVFVPHYH